MTTKREWVRPQAIVQKFQANEYVATCYSGKCNLTGGPFYKWNDKNGDGLATEDEVDQRSVIISSNRGCDTDFNATGNVTPVAAKINGEWQSGYYFEEYYYWHGILLGGDTHVTTGYEVSSAS